MVALLGPSGCGTTTILRMIAGHEEPTAGEIRIGGKNVAGLTPAARRTAMMFQSYALFPHLTVRDNIAFALRVLDGFPLQKPAKPRDGASRPPPQGGGPGHDNPMVN